MGGNGPMANAGAGGADGTGGRGGDAGGSSRDAGAAMTKPVDASTVKGDVAAGSASDVRGALSQSLATDHCYKVGCSGYWDRDPCRAFDGDLSTATGAGKTWTNQGSLAVDLGKSQMIAKVVVRYQTDAGNGPNPGYRIDSSDDGKTWRTVRDVKSPAQVDTQENLGINSRYLRIDCKNYGFDPTWMRSISEIEVSGP
jgi:hypothetical protein